MGRQDVIHVLGKMACQNGIHHMEGRMRNSAMEYRVTDGTTDLAWKSDVLIVEPKSVLIENNPRPPGTTSNTVILHTYHLLHPSSHGLIKITNMPPPNFEDELNHVSNLNTLILKKLFDFVFVHPTRGNDKSFNVSSRAAEAEKRKELSNYDTNQVLLPMLTTPYTSSRSKFKAGIFSRVPIRIPLFLCLPHLKH